LTGKSLLESALSVVVLVFLCRGTQASEVPQKTVGRIQAMPARPQPFVMRDWAQVAKDYDALVFDEHAPGQYLPFIWRDHASRRGAVGFGLPSYVGTTYQTGGGSHEAINCMAAVIGATLVGIDKSRQGGQDYVRMCDNYFSARGTTPFYLDGTASRTGGSFWYEVYPSLLFAQLVSLYPDADRNDKRFLAAAAAMLKALDVMAGKDGLPDFNHTAFDYEKMAPVDNGRWKEPDAAAAYAWFLFMAYANSGERAYLEGADRCMVSLLRNQSNPFYEVLLPYGAILAARMNAEHGRDYDVGKLLEWSFGPGKARPGWGVIAERWGEVDVGGLTGSLTDGGGYAFAMNTFDQAATLAPLPRYDQRYARAIGRYLLNAADSARLFYANAYDDARQNSAAWARANDPKSCIAYEGCRKRGRRSYVADADFATTSGTVASGDYRATRLLGERPVVREVLAEAKVDGRWQLDHVWSLTTAGGINHRLHAVAHVDGAGKRFRFSWSRTPQGPFTPMFVVDQQHVDRFYGLKLPDVLPQKIYVRAETVTAKGKAAADEPGKLLIDALYVMYEIDAGPFGMGDGGVGGRPRAVATDFALYGASHVGYLGGIVAPTNVEMILKVDLLKTDWFHGKAHPTFLFYNPYDEPKEVALDVGRGPVNLYDTVSQRFVGKEATGTTVLRVAPNSAAVIVLCPARGRVTRDAGRLCVDGVIVDYRAGKGELPDAGP